VIQLIHNYGNIQTVLDKADGTDLETCQVLAELLQKEYIRAG
jgi:hypothetical protein